MISFFVYLDMLSHKSGSRVQHRIVCHVTIDLYNNCYLFQSVYLLSRLTPVMNDVIICVTLLRVPTRVPTNFSRFDRNTVIGITTLADYKCSNGARHSSIK